ncbi:hypothetical protein HT585_20800 [Ensifer sp. HO-A22]|uniref:Uncharacterized protein n=1 Tax=Ensifer oleiphilus TaxID=2742698 RepID=A0A7Y6Q946_9HYPH|nr:hypothetical protein [Ensifer oleiphilus]NVD41319.1 hypothetical protein [Ensifer oleiphilus]
MFAPSLRDPGFVELVDEQPNGKFVVWDGQATGLPRAYGRKERWLVEHLESGRKRFYKTKKEARADARKCAQAVGDQARWWESGWDIL